MTELIQTGMNQLLFLKAVSLKVRKKTAIEACVFRYSLSLFFKIKYTNIIKYSST